MASDGPDFRVRQVDFTAFKSPWLFKSCLTVAAAAPDLRIQTFEHTFYISRIIKSGLEPSNFRAINEKEGNQFLVTNKPGFGKVNEGVVKLPEPH